MPATYALTHTHTYTDAHTHSPTLAHTHTHTNRHPCSHAHSLSRTDTHTHTRSHAHTHTHRHRHTISHTHPHSLPHTHTNSLPHTFIHTHISLPTAGHSRRSCSRRSRSPPPLQRAAVSLPLCLSVSLTDLTCVLVRFPLFLWSSVTRLSACVSPFNDFCRFICLRL